MIIQRTALPSLLAVAVLLGGCAEFPIFDKKPARNAAHPKAAVAERDATAREPAARPKERPHERDDAPRESTGLQEGIRLYDDGDYAGAIRRLAARDVNNGPLATRLAALKYTAFSYCVTSRPAQCRQAFDKALRLDPDFDLAPGEHGHPLWGPVFTRAKQAAGR
ncbi:TssQ family T6SS-associated lipoprotein [uncultured Massilia sp.]|uniref:TssQ family T6SS-associated lipoprotein n=1 Tax=uncultured Massilia sp. TaxID=169973 RepID=UPI0025D40780|nr:TssQ family T6SS-associated lipoprotein [uncultured Massilia sp.]